jgi:hypothetical protein
MIFMTVVEDYCVIFILTFVETVFLSGRDWEGRPEIFLGYRVSISTIGFI